MKYPFVRQYDAMDCGPSCLCMISRWYGRHFSLETIRKKSFITREGVSFLGLKSAAESLGFKAMGAKIPFSKLADKTPLPCIAHWQQNHFIVINKADNDHVWVSDPAIGRLRMTSDEFLKGWSQNDISDTASGMVLLLEPEPKFYEQPDDPKPEHRFSFMLKHLRPYKKQVVFLLLGLLAGSLIQLVFPFLTQAIIDRGVKVPDIGFIYLLLAGQLSLVLGRLAIEFSRGWLLVHMGTKMNISIVSEFLGKLMKLPIAFFDSKLDGDILQRIEDNNRIEAYLTSSSLGIVFSVFSFLIFAIVMAIYSLPILMVFLAGTSLYIIYVSLFMPARVTLDNMRFREMAEAGNKMINIVNGMQEIKLAGNEESNISDWEKIQTGIYKTRIKGLKLLQYQTAGGTLIHESVNILTTFISAMSVINGTMTLGMMLAVQFIAGQLNSPVSQIIAFLRATQDARMSVERLSEVHARAPEETPDDGKADRIPDNRKICLSDVSFRYEGPGSPYVIRDLTLEIPEDRVTAIVGESGSGKTTLLKLIMGFYQPEAGKISVGNMSIWDIKPSALRKDIGVVMQEGYLFPGTIVSNIAPGVNVPDNDRLAYAVAVSNLEPLILTLPLGLKTRIGQGGHGLSQGQKQRILIARVVYKNPSILLLDEATSALDASNEKTITQNLNEFFKGKTVVIVAHRLSTVKDADTIVVLEKGDIAETGTHDRLVNTRGTYYRLIKDQLQLGS